MLLPSTVFGILENIKIYTEAIMNFLEERIIKDGIVKEGNVLKVDSFLNHQMDIALFDRLEKNSNAVLLKKRLIKL